MIDRHAPDQLVSAIRDRIQDPTRATEGAEFVRPKLYPPTSNNVLDATEQALGFSLPAFLRRLYTEVGNGGYGLGMAFSVLLVGRQMMD
jgi:hypothetical protein